MRSQRKLSTVLALGSTLLFAQRALADTGSDTSNGAEDPVPPNVMFLIDNSSSMETCWDKDRTDTNEDGEITDDDLCTPDSSDATSTWRMATVVKAITAVVSGMDSGYFGLALTDPNNSSDPDGIGTTSDRDGVIIPLGSSKAEFLTAIGELKTSSTDSGSYTSNTSNAVPLAESLDDLRDYYETGNGTTDPEFMGESPIKYYCQESHVIIITDGVTPSTYSNPAIDSSVSAVAGVYAASPDLTGTPSTEGYYNQTLDNVSSYLANTDLSILQNDPSAQHVITHVLVIDHPSDLLSYTVENSGGVYGVVDTKDAGVEPDDLEGELWSVMNTINTGVYSKAPPTVSTDGDMLYLGYYEVKPDRPLYYGHLVGYTIQNDPTLPGFGDIDTSISQPAWDAGVILASRWVGIQDKMDQDNNGEGWRDIYTNIENDSTLDPFDASNMVDLDPLCNLMLDTEYDSEGDYEGVALGHDVDGDGDVDLDDCKQLMDFVRGYYLEEFISTGQPRGHWKLGDIRHSQVAVADRDPHIYTRNPYLRQFLDEELPQELTDCPYSDTSKCELDVVFVAANDGMVHAFGKNSGDELWAYIPRNLLGMTSTDTEEKAELLDLMRGETVIMDATPRIDYIWIDGYQGQGIFDLDEKDGEQKVHEWARVLVIGQGGGGRYYTALDITDPQRPYLLWEDTNDKDNESGFGDTTSTAALGLIYDSKNGPAYDNWVAFYGSGHENGSSVEGRLYIKALEDLGTTAAAQETYVDEGIEVEVDLDGDGEDDGTGFPSNPTAVDKDNDGDIDEVFLVNSAGAMYKFVIDTSNIDKTDGCLFFDPQSARVDASSSDHQYVGKRTSSYYAATAAFKMDGSLVLYWGTGSPYDMFTTDNGYFYAVVDSEGCEEGVLDTACNSTGYVALESGEKLTGTPVVYARAVYFTTFSPSSDRCSEGAARLYGLSSEDCSPALDTNGDGTVDTDTDSPYLSLGEGIPSEVVIANDSIYVATTGGLSDGESADGSINHVSVANDPFSGTVAIQWRELY